MTKRTFGRIFEYTYAVPSALAKSHLNTDKRDRARYSIPEAASFISVPERTMRSWLRMAAWPA